MTLRELLVERRITQAAAARALGVSQSTLSRWCSRSVGELRVKHLNKLARLVGKTSVELLLPREPYVTVSR